MTVTSNAIIAMTNAHKQALLGIAIIATTLVTSGCNTVSVSQQTKSKVISSQRGNIVSDDKLSSNTASTLLSAGLNEKACLQHFELCLGQLSDSLLDDNYRPELAIFAELHYAKARQLAKSTDCLAALSRPPIDPYFANAPLDDEQAKNKQQRTSACLMDYQERLFDAVKSSYAYLFYDRLEHDFESAAEAEKKNHVYKTAFQTMSIFKLKISITRQAMTSLLSCISQKLAQID